jgi:hypothetical protein
MPWPPTIAVRLLGRPATSEPYTILIMVLAIEIFIGIDLKFHLMCQTSTGLDVWQVVRRDGGQVDG